MKYYDLFLSNSLKRKQYKIILKNGTKIVGIPVCFSFANPSDLKFNITTTVNGIKTTHSYNIDDIQEVEES